MRAGSVVQMTYGTTLVARVSVGVTRLAQRSGADVARRATLLGPGLYRAMAVLTGDDVSAQRAAHGDGNRGSGTPRRSTPSMTTVATDCGGRETVAPAPSGPLKAKRSVVPENTER